jgi:glycosyltransferase involved in cell wall biosynthesis
MRIAHIESGRHFYGGAAQVLHLIEGLRREGVDNTLLCPLRSAVATAALARGLCHVVELPLRGDADIGAVRRFGRSLRSLRHLPDIVHVHSRRGADLFGGLASIGAPWRAVLTRRVDDREWPPWARWKYRPYAAVIAISRAVEAELVSHVALPPERVHRVPSGVPLPDSVASTSADEATRTHAGDAHRRERLALELGLPRDARIAGVIAQLIPRKGHRVLLDALARVLTRHPQWHVAFFGRGPLETALRREIGRRGLAGRVHLAGFRADVRELLPGLDLVLHPALREGLGLAVLEAMAAGVPVAASRAGGLVDVIEHGASGLLVAPGDSRAWADALEQLLLDPAACSRLGSAGRQRIAERFTAQRMVLDNLAVYRAVLSSSAAGSASSTAPSEAAPHDGSSGDGTPAAQGRAPHAVLVERVS